MIDSVQMFRRLVSVTVHLQDGEDEAFKDLAEEKEDGAAAAAAADDDDDEEERFVDADKLEEGGAGDKGGGAEPRPAASWVHHQNLEGGSDSASPCTPDASLSLSLLTCCVSSCWPPGGKSVQRYDPLHRNPLFCGADRSALWELQQVSHPLRRQIISRDTLQATQSY